MLLIIYLNFVQYNFIFRSVFLENFFIVYLHDKCQKFQKESYKYLLLAATNPFGNILITLVSSFCDAHSGSMYIPGVQSLLSTALDNV